MGSKCISLYNEETDELICRSCPVYGTVKGAPACPWLGLDVAACVAGAGVAPMRRSHRGQGRLFVTSVSEGGVPALYQQCLPQHTRSHLGLLLIILINEELLPRQP